MPVTRSTVLASSFGPPKAYAAFSLPLPCPSIGTYESRGRLTRVGRPLSGMCSSIIVSVRLPTAFPVASFLRCAAVRPARLSDPTSSQSWPGVSAGRPS
ncbi:hypothetical protein GCM10027612_09660 [Microbispora bryophytorum subsp. camponoti]